MIHFGSFFLSYNVLYSHIPQGGTRSSVRVALYHCYPILILGYSYYGVGVFMFLSEEAYDFLSLPLPLDAQF